MEGYEQNLHIADSAFEGMRHDADRVLQKLLKNMVEKESLEGSVTIKIDISLTQEFIENTDPDVEGETRKVLTPAFTHKVGSMMQIKDEAKGGINYEGMEMVWDDELKEFVVKPIANTTQRTIFDTDFQCVNDPENGKHQSDDQKAIEGRNVAALPWPSEDEGEEDSDEDVENAAGGDTEGSADISNEFEDDSIPFSDDDYGYDDLDDF